MARLTSIKSTLKPFEGRKLAAIEEAATGDGWGSGRGGRPWRRRRAAILLRDQYTCKVCGVTTNQLEVDHIVNLAQGGSDNDDNLQAMCTPCHKAKTAREATAHR
ncbi:HNH endonuclease [Pseudomonas sp. B21-053]|uniref:HNH endonuclease n=1 Tax=Pseudomonas sp. B21-053 TaxID=2895493 RepID=UPI00222E3022|nr:HNH endonuclease [Pseudomonas sp. B21-053]UZE12777.1 HNH endonuclease [Pseudomonas sp. B21-053]